MTRPPTVAGPPAGVPCPGHAAHGPLDGLPPSLAPGQLRVHPAGPTKGAGPKSKGAAVKRQTQGLSPAVVPHRPATCPSRSPPPAARRVCCQPCSRCPSDAAGAAQRTGGRQQRGADPRRRPGVLLHVDRARAGGGVPPQPHRICAVSPVGRQGMPAARAACSNLEGLPGR